MRRRDKIYAIHIPNTTRGKRTEGKERMEYRINGRTGDRIGVIGMGASSLHEAGEKEGTETVALAYERGVNYFDLARAKARVSPATAERSRA